MLGDELTILGLYGLLVAITLVLQASGMLTRLGMGYMLSARDETHTITGITARLERALTNSVTAMALFAPAILILAVRDRFGDASLTAAQVFLVARIVYLPSYAFGVTGIRSLAWTAGFFATIVLYVLGL